MLNYRNHIDFSRDVEAAIIGACLLEKTAVARVYNLCKPENFYFIDTKIFARAIWLMFEDALPVDIITVADFVIRTLNIYHTDGRAADPRDVNSVSDIPATLARITNGVVSTANLEFHAVVLKQMYISRKIKDITNGTFELRDNPRADLAKLQKELNALNETVYESDWLRMDELILKLLNHQDKLSASGGTGLKTGFKQLDDLNGGLFPGNVIVLGARPSVGKSAFAGQIALNVARQNKKVGIISLEMNNVEISARIAAIDTETNFADVYRSLFADQMQRERFFKRVTTTTEKLSIFISDKTDVRAVDIRAKAGQLKNRYGLDLLIIDYLQLIGTDDNKNKSRENEISQISRACKVMAKELNCPVIELCQLNREITRRRGADRYPGLADLRESGSIEQDADIVLFLHSDFLSGYIENENKESTEGEADLFIKKWRNGKLGRIYLSFDGPKMQFTEKAHGPTLRNPQTIKNYYEPAIKEKL